MVCTLNQRPSCPKVDIDARIKTWGFQVSRKVVSTVKELILFRLLTGGSLWGPLLVLAVVLCFSVVTECTTSRMALLNGEIRNGIANWIHQKKYSSASMVAMRLMKSACSRVLPRLCTDYSCLGLWNETHEGIKLERGSDSFCLAIIFQFGWADLFFRLGGQEL